MQKIKKEESKIDYKLQEVLLSVVIPIYNTEQYLARCLDSVLEQDITGMEIICVNDGSTDNSLSILQDYASKHSCIRIINQPNGGLVKARKAGLQATTGKYISYIDSDDWIEPGMYAAMLDAIIVNDADVVTSDLIRDYGNYRVVDHENFKAGIYEDEKLLYEIKSHLIETDVFFKSNINMHITNKLYKRNILLKHQINVHNKISIGEDAAVVYPVLLDANKVVIIGQSYYHYCIRSDSMMGQPSRDVAEKSALLTELLTREFNRHPEVINGMSQCKNLITYTLLMSYAPSIITYQDMHLSLYGRVALDEKLVIYGAGKLGQILYDLLLRIGFKVVAWVDKNEKYLNVADLQNINFDKVLIAVANYDMIMVIKGELQKAGIPSKKIMSLRT